MSHNLLFIPLVPLAAWHILSYAAYSWSHKNKKAAVGLVIMAIAAVALPIVVMIRND